MGEKKHINKNPQKSRDKPVKFLFMCFFLYVFFRSLTGEGKQVGLGRGTAEVSG